MDIWGKLTRDEQCHGDPNVDALAVAGTESRYLAHKVDGKITIIGREGGEVRASKIIDYQIV